MGSLAVVDSWGPHEVVLGSKAFAPNGRGFGKAHPGQIYNGGVISGYVRKIRWKNWGGSTARGHGRGYQYKPNGGYYSQKVEVKLRAKKIGHCRGSSRPAYTRLRAQFQERPGGKFGNWFNWAGDKNICSYG